ncbi:MAG: MerR family transcriptional regulator [Candidatus Binatia bacterium]
MDSTKTSATSSEVVIDELARRAGTTTRNVRLYQSRGLLPPPQRRGRIAYYNDEHLARLQLIGRLQERGFSLASIDHLLEAWGQHRGLSDILGFGERVVTGWNAEEEQFLALTQLAERFPEGLQDPELFRRAIALGLFEIAGDGVRIPRPSLLRAGEALVAAGIPLSAVLTEMEKTKVYLQEIAAGAVGLFQRYVWQPFIDAGMPPEQLPKITAALEQLRPLVSTVVQARVSQALEQAAANATAEQFALISQETPDTSKKAS